MKGRTIALDQLGEAEAAALIVDGKLEDLLIDSDHARPGTIYRGIAQRPMKGQGGMFLDTPEGSAFLRQVKGLAPGQPLIVQVTGFAEPGKAIPVTTRILFKSRYAIVTPGAPGLNISRRIKDEDIRESLLEIAHEVMPGANEAENGLILRSSCAEGNADEIAEDIAAMAQLCAQVMADVSGKAELLVEGDGPHSMAWREWDEGDVDAEPGAFERHDVHEMIAALQRPLVPLPGAGLSVVLGAQIGDFTGQSLFDAFNSDWTVDQRADRMGVRLLGPTLRCARSAMTSEGVPLGAIQVPADGQPIILLNDRQTIGGYPRLGALTPLAVAQLAQCRPGTVLRLKPVALERAQREQRRLLASWQRTTTE